MIDKKLKFRDPQLDGGGDIQLMAQFYSSRMSSYRQTETLAVETYS